MEAFKYAQDMNGHNIYRVTDDPSEDMLLARKQVIYALRNTPEQVRGSGWIGTATSEKVCALGLMARQLELFESISISAHTGEDHYSTPATVNALAASTGWPRDLLIEAYRRNDARVRNGYEEKVSDLHPGQSWVKIEKGPFSYTWPQIADFLEGARVDS